MPKKRSVLRGRKPQISTAHREVVALRRQVRVLLTGLGRLQSRLAMLDAYHGKSGAAAPAKRSATWNDSLPQARKLNIRDIAAEILKRAGKPMAIAVLAEKVMKARGKKSGKMFATNLGTALRADWRFRRVGRGVYGLRGRVE